MADNNKNPRRTIWLSETEPLSHYDIWLSKNQHLNSDGELVSTSGVLRPCDYIFKVWDCDNWYPIVGLNSTAVDKIDTVWNTNGYTDSYGTFHSGQYSEFNVPLFTRQGNSPAELFNGGTIGLVIQNYVTEEEWQLIFEGDTFEGDTIINKNLKPAAFRYLGGIWADTFTLIEIFPDTPGYLSPTNNLITESNNWLVLAKYKPNHDAQGFEDYNLYVNAKDIINAINQYQEDNQDVPSFDLWLAEEDRIGGIKAGRIFKADLHFLAEVGFMNDNEGDPTYGKLFVNPQDIVSEGIELATPTEIGGITADTISDSNVNIEDLTEVKFFNSSNPAGEYYGRLFVKSTEVTENAFEDPLFISDLLWDAFENSPSIKKDWNPNVPGETRPRFSIYGSYDLGNNGGKFLRLRTQEEMAALTPPSSGEEPYNNDYNRVLWVDISDYLGVEGGEAIEIVNTQLQNKRINLKYNNESFSVITDAENELVLKPATPSTLGGIKVGDGLYMDNGFLSVVASNTPEQIDIEAGTGIIITPIDTTTKRISIETLGGNAGDVLLIVDTDTVGWRTISPSTPTTYTGGIGINIDTEHNNAINIADVNPSNKGRYLRVNEDGDDVEWNSISSGTEYSAGVGIKIDSSNYINIDTEGATDGQVLSYNSNDLDVEWTTVLTYTEGVGIDITDNEISSEIDINTEITALSQLAFNCVLGTANDRIGNVTVSADLGTPSALAPFSYTKINLGEEGESGNVTFSVYNLKACVNGDPVFIELNLAGTITLTINNDSEHDNDCYIDSNGVLQGNGFKEHHVLVTIQFGIVKFEAIKTYSAIGL